MSMCRRILKPLGNKLEKGIQMLYYKAYIYPACWDGGIGIHVSLRN